MDETFNQLQNWANTHSAIIVELGAGIIVILIAFQIVIRSLSNYIKAPKLRLQVRQGLRGIQIFVIVLFVGLVFSPSLRHLMFSLSAVGAVATLALKDLSSSLSGWFAIIFGNLYKHGDRVQIGDTVGDIIKISPTQTTLMECGEWLESDAYTGRIVHLNNSTVVQKLIFNYSDQFPFLWDAVWVPLDYSSDRNLAQKLVQEAIEKAGSEQVEKARKQWSSFPHQSSLNDISFDPQIRLSSNKDYMELKVTYIVHYSQRGMIKNHFFHYLLKTFDHYRDQVKFPIDTLQLLSNQ